jgi:hypothetical protein
MRFRRRSIADSTLLELHELRHSGKLGLEVFESAFVLDSELLHNLVELRLVSVDLLLKQAGTVLQVASDVTHCCPLASNDYCSNDRAGWQVQRKTLEACRPPLGKLR